MLIGEYHHNMDAKGRISIPSKFRDDMGGTFVLAKGSENCLCGYSVSEWNTFKNNLIAMRTPKIAKIRRFLFSSSVECEIDPQGRIVVPNELREYAKLEKEVTIIGNENKIEFWTPEAWNSYMENDEITAEELSEVMESLGM